MRRFTSFFLPIFWLAIICAKVGAQTLICGLGWDSSSLTYSLNLETVAQGTCFDGTANVPANKIQNVVGNCQCNSDQAAGECCNCPAYENQVGAPPPAICGPPPNSCYCTPGTTCVNCNPGDFCDGSGYGSCQPCPLGKYSHTSGAKSACTPCSKWSISKTDVPIQGTFQNKTGQSLCFECEAGKFASSDGATECVTDPTSQQTSYPSGQPSCQPSRIPTLQPSSTPTGQPSRQPSNLPTSQPSSTPSSHPTTNPTYYPYSVRTWQGATNLSHGPQNEPEKIYYEIVHTFTNMGHDYSGDKRWYLTVNILESGFGYPYHQYVSATAGYKGSTDGDGDGDGNWMSVVKQCSPGATQCSPNYVTCSENVDVTDLVVSEGGGSLTIKLRSHLVPFITRECLVIAGGTVIG